MSSFVKKAVEVEARQYIAGETNNNGESILGWICEHGGEGELNGRSKSFIKRGVLVHEATYALVVYPTGSMGVDVKPNDWVVKDTDGSFFVIIDDLFKKEFDIKEDQVSNV